MFSAKSLQLVRDWYWGVQFHWNRLNTKEQNNLVILLLVNSVFDKMCVLYSLYVFFKPNLMLF